MNIETVHKKINMSNRQMYDQVQTVLFGNEMEINGEKRHLVGVVELQKAQQEMLVAHNQGIIALCRLLKITPHDFVKATNDKKANDEFIEKCQQEEQLFIKDKI